MSSPLIISLHNYKTAGVTFYSIIDRQFHKEEIVNSNLIGFDKVEKFLIESTDEEKAKKKIIHGHFPFGIDKYISQANTYITFVRNPIDRVVSDYFYCRNFPLAHNYQYASRMTFKEYLTCNEILNIDNGLTRFISGDTNTLYGDDSQEMLDRAIDNLEKRFSFIGITEKYDESLVLVNHIFSWNRYYYKSKNITFDKSYDFDEEIESLIKSRNKLDFQLYEYALARHRREFDKVPFAYVKIFYLKLSKLLYNSIHPVFSKIRSLVIFID